MTAMSKLAFGSADSHAYPGLTGPLEVGGEGPEEIGLISLNSQ